MLGAAVTILLVELVIYQKRDEASRLDAERMRRRDHFVTQLRACFKSFRQLKLRLYKPSSPSRTNGISTREGGFRLYSCNF